MGSVSKRRVLFVGEASFLATGFAVYWHEVIKRLHATGEFSIAELGSYAHDDDERCKQVLWKFYPVAPARSDKRAMQEYMPHPGHPNQFGQARFEDVCFDWKPDIVCVPPGTKVETPNGIKNIENIKIGEFVISHTGKSRKVLANMRRQHTGNVIDIYPYNDNQCYTFTPEHPILVIKGKKRTWKQRDVKERHNISDAQFIEASQLSVGDYVLIPIYRPKKEHSGILDVTDYIDQFIYDEQDKKIYPVGHKNYKKDNGIPKCIEITKDFARFLGYYVAEGSCSRGQIQLSFGTTERENQYVCDVQQLIQHLFNLPTSVVKSKTSDEQSIYCCSTIISNLMSAIVGVGAHNKIIPSCILQSNSTDLIQSFLEGLIKGDGCYKPDTVSLCTVSEKLARQVRMLLARIGIKASICSRLNKPNELVKCERLSFDVECYGQFARLAHKFVGKHSELLSRKTNNPKWIDKGNVGWIENNYIVVPIRRIRTKKYSGQVYNLEVEQDNSYVTGFSVHNCMIRDWWMDEFILRSSVRNNFKIYWMPTIDGEPQRELWLDSYRQCDRILTYSEYGMNLLRKTGRRGTELVTVASPGADLEIFKPPENKRDHKAKLGIDPNSLIIGTVMRNQKRKLYYDLIEAFSMWLHKSKSRGHVDLAKRTFLYLHTSYPDVGYDIGKAIRDFKIGNRVIMTYLCGECNTAYPSFFAGELTICRKCGKLAAHPPNANHSCPRNVLADIMKTFDLYVQYSICLHPDTPIMASDGWKNIGDIKVGDKVIGKDGKLHRVYKTMKNPSSKCLDVVIKGRPWSVTATDNHPWLTVDQTGLSKGLAANISAKVNPIERIVNRERYHKSRGTECPGLKFTYKRTDELRSGDLLASRIPTEEILPNYDLPFMDEDMAYYLGLFAADGHANESCGQCVITSHKKESSHVMELCQSIASRLNKDAKQYGYNDREAVNTNICDTKFRNQIRNLCYHAEDKTKTLPSGCHLWPIKLQKELVKGLIYGDGHWKRDNLNIYATTSIHIAKILGPILDRIGWYYCCHIQYRDNRLPIYKFEIRTDGQRKSHETLHREGFILTKVASSNQSDFDGEVVNIDVEDDHHYVTLEGLQHNCEGFGMPCVDAIACGVPVAAVDYSAMQDHLRCPTSIPISIKRFFWECIIETEQKRALPDNQDFVNKLDCFLKQSESRRDEKSKQTRAYAEELIKVYGRDIELPRYSWERTAAIWGQVLRETEICDQQTTWLCPTSRINNPNLVPPSNNMSNSEFVNWVIGKVWNRPDMLRTHFAGGWLQCLNSNSRTMGDKRVPFNRQMFVEHFTELVRQANAVEQKRLALTNNEASDQMKVTIL